MSFDGTPIIFLESSDFDQAGRLVYKGKRVTSGKWFIMIQGGFCGYCTKAKPAFVEAASELGSKHINKGIVFATIHVDSKYDEDKKLASKIKDISGHSLDGIPAFLLYDTQSGKFSLYEGSRTKDGFISFLRQQ